MDSSPTHLTNKTISSDETLNTKPSVPLFNQDNEYSNLHKILQFGRELFQMKTTLEQANNHDDIQVDSKLLRVTIQFFNKINLKFYLFGLKIGCQFKNASSNNSFLINWFENIKVIWVNKIRMLSVF